MLSAEYDLFFLLLFMMYFCVLLAHKILWKKEEKIDSFFLQFCFFTHVSAISKYTEFLVTSFVLSKYNRSKLCVFIWYLRRKKNTYKDQSHLINRKKKNRLLSPIRHCFEENQVLMKESLNFVHIIDDKHQLSDDLVEG